MLKHSERALVEEIISANRYLTIATSSGESPWIAPLEYLADKDLNFYFFSLPSSQHAKDLERNENVAVAIFDPVQAEYTPGTSLTLRGVQIQAKARLLDENEYPPPVVSAIEALRPPMPPYSVYKIAPVRFYLPRIENGVNVRIEVQMSQ